MLEFKNEGNIDNEISKLKRITSFISAGSIILTANLIAWAICLITLDNPLLYGIVTAISFIIFLAYLIFTYRFYVALAHKNNVKKVYFNHRLRRNNEYSKFFDTGSDLIDKEDYKELDLDLFGKNSLFQYLSVCKTKYGRLKLKEALTTPRDNDTDYTDTIEYLANDEHTVEIEARLLEFKSDAKKLDYDIMYQAFETKIKFNPLWLIPILSFLGTIVYLILIFTLGLNPYFLFIFGFTNFILAKLCLKNEVFDIDSTNYYYLMDNYYYLSKELESIDPKAKRLEEIKHEASKSILDIRKIKNILNLLSTRRNIIFNIFSNLICIFDLFIILIFNNKAKSIINLKKYFELVGELECMMSLANIGMDNEVYTKPNDGEINGVDMYHPLIKNCVPNSLALSGGIILTGSNMSGKTTFMRTLGICQTLYNAKGLIPAKSFTSTNLNIYTSLRANDMLAEGISTFYAEILRMKKINEAIKSQHVLVLIDEIFKGTNATDRISASLKVIDKLNSFNASFIITTHDFELCDANNITNYHFNEEYINDKISFDYMIKEGKCETKNAIYLLKMADII